MSAPSFSSSNPMTRAGRWPAGLGRSREENEVFGVAKPGIEPASTISQVPGPAVWPDDIGRSRGENEVFGAAKPGIKPTLCLCQDCLMIASYSDERHDGIQPCKCGGDYCGCSYCQDFISTLFHGYIARAGRWPAGVGRSRAENEVFGAAKPGIDLNDKKFLTQSEKWFNARQPVPVLVTRALSPTSGTFFPKSTIAFSYIPAIVAGKGRGI